MPPEHHVPEWPDKVVYAALLLMLGGGLGVLFAALDLAGATIDVGGAVFLEAFHPIWILTLSAATTALGAVGLRYQAWIWCTIGIVTAVLSMGVFGILPLSGLVAAGSLVKAWSEGEEMKHDEQVMHADQWPDKAIMASMLFTTLGLSAGMQAILVLLGRYGSPYLDGSPAIVAALAAFTTLAAFLAARACFHQRWPWSAWVAGILGIVVMPFWVIGPAVAALALLFVALAGREEEFRPEKASANA